MSSLVHPPPTRYNYKNAYAPVKAFFKKNACQKNTLLFLPDVFHLVNGKVTCHHRFTIDELKLLYPLLAKKIFYIPKKDNPLTNAPSNQSFLSISSSILATILPPDTAYPDLHRFDYSYPMLYDNMTNIHTSSYARDAATIFKTYGFSNMAVILFFQLYFNEYFTLISPTHCTQDGRVPDFTFLSLHNDKQADTGFFNKPIHQTSRMTSSSIKIYFNFMLPLLEPNSTEIQVKQQIILGDRPNWRCFGTRATFLQFFSSPQFQYEELVLFHKKFLILCFLYCRFIPSFSSNNMWLIRRKMIEFRPVPNTQYRSTNDTATTTYEQISQIDELL
jgi:hypothetical protein